LRLYGKNDCAWRHLNFRRAAMTAIIAEVICDSICMSTYKAAQAGR